MDKESLDLSVIASQGRAEWLQYNIYTLQTAYLNSSGQRQITKHLCSLLRVWGDAYSRDRTLYQFIDEVAHPFLASIKDDSLDILLSESQETGFLLEHAELLIQWPTRQRLTKPLKNKLSDLKNIANSTTSAPVGNGARVPIFRIIDILGLSGFLPEDFRNFLDELVEQPLMLLFTQLQQLKYFSSYLHRLSPALPLCSHLVS